jgi:N6-L-threonylcarbamoyladenine synthase
MSAHILAHFASVPSPPLQERGARHEADGVRHPQFPFLCLTVSGGHTQIVLAKDYLSMEVLGETIDDAAGEAFDKAAKILGLPYPGGPLIDKHAQTGNPNAFQFSEPNIPGLNFSFSGLKTSVLYFIRDKVREDKNFIEKNLNDICASVQHTIVKILIDKITSASSKTDIKEIAIAGGVSANSGLRNGIITAGKKHGWNTYIPPFEYCTDNAAMIAVAGHYKYIKGEFAEQGVAAMARYKL